MMLENGKHEMFAQKWHETENKSEAYRYAFPRSLEWLDASVHSKACKLSKNTKVKARYDELKQETADAHGITVSTLLTELEEARLIGKQEGTAGGMVSATMGKAKLVGLDVVKVEITSAETLTPWNFITIGEDIASELDEDSDEEE